VPISFLFIVRLGKSQMPKRKSVEVIDLTEGAPTKKKVKLGCGCKKKLTRYNLKGEKPLYCKSHKKSGMVDVTKKLCESIDCTKRSSFNLEGQTHAKYCAKHKEANMIDVRNKKCGSIGCTKIPSFNLKGETKARYCFDHKETSMVNVVSAKCESIGCPKIPSFNLEGQTHAKYCFDHKEVNMIDVKNKTCESIGCAKFPSFNLEGQTHAKYCFDHKEPNMIDVRSKKCESIGCPKIPSFNLEGENYGKYCSDHKKSNMIDVKSKSCESIGCTKGPSFNVQGETRAKYCFDHKEPNMIHVKSRICESIGCTTRPTFNLEGEKYGKYCSDHKESNMIDVVNKKCEGVDCTTTASFGVPGFKASRCAKHLTSGMIYNPKQRCCDAFDGKCKSFAQYGIILPIHCEEHKTEEEENLCRRTCVECKELEICNEDGLCYEYCINAKMFKRSKHKKELRVKCLLQSEINQTMHSYDKSIDLACTKKRPDIVYDCGTHFVIVEIDENQHRYYDCEINRILEITQSAGLPCIFIRYNPDKFVDSTGSKIAIITNSEREKVLVSWVKHAMETEPRNEVEFLRVVYLFYDGHDHSSIDLECLDV
jgi:hypothetical protein